jgi:multisubunit Na+/H+ antiporter MnhC subunit
MGVAQATVALWVKAVVVWGMFLWMALNVINHLRDLKGTRHAIAVFMRMEPLDQPPPIPTPLKNRRIDSPLLHTLVLVVIVVIQLLCALLFGASALWFVIGDAVYAVRVGMWAFVWFVANWFLFLIGGAWFAYWLRQDGLQRTHLALLQIGFIGLLLMSI